MIRTYLQKPVSWKKAVPTLLIAALISALMLSQIYAAVPNSGPYYLDIPFGTASYYVGKFVNGSTYMVKGDNWKCTWNSLDSIAVLRACIGNLTSGGSVYIQPPFYADGELVITTSNITIKSHLYPNSPTTSGVNIDRIKIDSTSNGIRGVRIEGIFFYQIWFYQAGSNSIQQIYFDYCQVQASAGVYSEGIIFGGDDTAAIHNIYFSNCYFYDMGQSSREGFISFTHANGGNGQIYFNNIHYDTKGAAGNYVFMAFEDEGLVSPDIVISNSDLVFTTGGTSWVFCKLLDQTNPSKKGGFYSMKIHHNWIEIHGTTTLFSIEASSELTRFSIIAEGNTVEDGTGTTTTIINNLNSNWENHNQGLTFCDNWIVGFGTVNIGTPGTSTYFQVSIENNRGLSTEATGTTSGSNSSYFSHGLVATPTTVSLTCMNGSYGGVPVIVNCIYSNTNSTHAQISLHWANGTAITTDLLISYTVKYDP